MSLNIDVSRLQVCPPNYYGFTKTIANLLKDIPSSERTAVFTSDGCIFFWVAENHVIHIIQGLSTWGIEFTVNWNTGHFIFRINNVYSK